MRLDEITDADIGRQVLVGPHGRVARLTAIDKGLCLITYQGVIQELIHPVHLSWPIGGNYGIV